MAAKILLPSSFYSKSIDKHYDPIHIFLSPSRRQHPHLLRATGPEVGSDNEATAEDVTKSDTTTINPSPRPPKPTLKIKYRSRSKNQAKQQQQQQQQQSVKPPPPPKDWDSMTLAEKAVELYVGEKGLLFWLNKFAYASIFIIIGGWILFRFVGPSIGLYQLDSAPLSPTSLFKG